ncbi:hypothetical protein L484_003286 [Morus notabilis]|uniref:Uncharacterized protein n=1 Tax=Morus notabilis TaxID=981085 RepID=W9R3E5_9ROSA|nr:hypothetical protein L484_003286 [Morus notabilis]
MAGYMVLLLKGEGYVLWLKTQMTQISAMEHFLYHIREAVSEFCIVSFNYYETPDLFPFSPPAIIVARYFKRTVPLQTSYTSPEFILGLKYVQKIFILFKMNLVVFIIIISLYVINNQIVGEPLMQEILETREKAKPHIWTLRSPEEASTNWEELFGHLDEVE